MKPITKALSLFSLIPIFLLTGAHAQKGKIRLPRTLSIGGGIHTDSQVPITNYEIYLLGIGTSADGTPTSMISCDNDDGGVTVGSDDGDTTCYAVGDSSGDFNLTGLYYGYTDGTGCTTNGGQSVYLEVRKGDVGSNSNPNLGLVAIPPSTWTCDYIHTNASSINLVVSDFTNVMAGLALAPFTNWNNPLSPDGISAAGSTGKKVSSPLRFRRDQ